MYLIGTNKNIKQFLQDIPVDPNEKVSEFVQRFKEFKTLKAVSQGLYNIIIDTEDHANDRSN